MGTKINSNYSDLLTFTRASKGHALRPVSYGDELVTNGDFSSTDLSDWDSYRGGDLSVESGVLVVEGTGASFAGVTHNVSTKVNKVYKISLEIASYGTGTGNPRLESPVTSSYVTSTSLTAFEFVFVATSTTTVIRVASGSSGGGNSKFKVDNVTLKEVFFDQPDGTLTLFEHPNNVPRVEWDADRNRLGLLVEEQRVNLATYSVVTDANWSKSDSTINDNQLQAPNKITEAAKIVENTNSSTHYVSLACSGNTSTTYTGSFFLKSAEREEARVRIGQSGNYVDVWIDLTDGSLGSTSTGGTGSYSTSSSTDYGNGWYRVSVTGSGIGSGSSIALRVDLGSGSETALYTGDGSSGVYVWGAQFEAGSFPTSYMKNEGTASGKDRSADVASIPVADFGWNTDIGSVVAEYNPLNVSDAINPVFELSSDSTNNRLYSLASTSKHWFVRSNAVTTADIDLGTPIESQQNKIAGAYKKDDFAASLNGGAVGTDTAGSMSVGIEDILIGSLHNNYYLNGHIKSIKYYPRRLTNAQLQDLTS